MATGGEKRAALLRQITEEGGFAFVASAEKAAAGDLRAAEAAREMAWEQLHSAPRAEVDDGMGAAAWRDAYALACLHVAALRAAAGERRAALPGARHGAHHGRPPPPRRARRRHRGARPRRGGRGRGRRWGRAEVEGRDRRVPRPCRCTQTSTSEFPIFGCIEHWPARTKWKDIKYLQSIAGDRTIPVQVGKNYACTELKQELITFSQFLERMWSSDSANLVYLAQHLLFDQIKELHEDITVPEYCLAGGGKLQSLNAWFGPHGTITPLHHDPHHSLFAQVLGRKYVRLYPASISVGLYPNTEGMLSNTSQIFFWTLWSTYLYWNPHVQLCFVTIQIHS